MMRFLCSFLFLLSFDAFYVVFLELRRSVEGLRLGAYDDLCQIDLKGEKGHCQDFVVIIRPIAVSFSSSSRQVQLY